MSVHGSNPHHPSWSATTRNPQDRSADTRHHRLLRIAAAIPLVPIIVYAQISWLGFVSELETEDKVNHLLALEYGYSKASEPLWGILAPLIGQLFPDDPFAAAVIISAALIIFGLCALRYPFRSILLIIFSPGMVYLVGFALRQGFAVGVFLVCLGLFKRFRARRFETPSDIRTHIVLGAVVSTPAILIHSSIIIALGYLIICWSSNALRSSVKRLSLEFLFLAVSSCLVMKDFIFNIIVRRSVLLLWICQSLLFAYECSHPRHRGRWNDFAIFIMMVALGFSITVTGVRVLIMLAILSPLILGNKATPILLFGLWFYPLFDSYYADVNMGRLLPY